MFCTLFLYSQEFQTSQKTTTANSSANSERHKSTVSLKILQHQECDKHLAHKVAGESSKESNASIWR